MLEEVIRVVAILAFFVLLAAAIFMIISFYICDNQTCHAFIAAEDVGAKGSKEYTTALLGELYKDGIWPFPYIGAAILTGLCLWLIGVNITIRMFAVVFLVSFIVIYFLFAYVGHHYIKFITAYVADYIENNCDVTAITNNITIIEEETNSE